MFYACKIQKMINNFAEKKIDRIKHSLKTNFKRTLLFNLVVSIVNHLEAP